MLLQRMAPGQDWPTPKERQAMGYHQKHATTSPLYEKIRAKYPNWSWSANVLLSVVTLLGFHLQVLLRLADFRSQLDPD